MVKKTAATSPSASGPAGSLFEGQVGAHYLLTMLAEADPRGLPGATIQSIQFQRAGEGHPLDDVIVSGLTRAGDLTVLEIQVKRTITFAPTDAVFKDVVKQLAQAFGCLDLSNERHQFAVATEKSSFKITGPYQDLLRWAREVGMASTFIDRINRKNVGNDDMRKFIKTVRTQLAAADCTSDDETIWQILRRFQILTFDYDAAGSQSLDLALERARRSLDPTDAALANGLWKALTETAIRSAASGGDLDRKRLVSELSENVGFRLISSWRNRAPRDALAEAAALTAADLRHKIAGVILSRQMQVDAVRAAQDKGRYIEIRGEPGVGKSGVLSMLAQQTLTEGHAIVLSPSRTIAGGWLAMKTALGVDLGAQEFLTDLASDGGAVLFIDSLDFFDDPAKRATVIDLVRSAAEVPNFQVIVTARTDFNKEEPNWLPAEALTKLGQAPLVVVKELGTEEIDELKAAVPSLAALLAENHPARNIARNLFRLSRLLEVQGSTEELRSEVDLLERWWATADGEADGCRDRARLLAEISDAALEGLDFVETRAPPSAIDALIATKTLKELGLDRLAFQHDVLREWGLAARLHDNSSKLDQLPLAQSPPNSIARGIELGARFALERSENGERWVAYVDRVSPYGAHASWRRWSILAILRSELAFTLLERASGSLFENDGVLLKELIRTTIAAESRPLTETLSEKGFDARLVPSGIFGPNNESWSRLAQWLLLRQIDIPLQVIPDVVQLFQGLSASMFFADPITPLMADALVGWLEEIEDAQEISPFADEQPRFAAAFRYHELYKLAEDTRQAFVLMSARVPERAQRYLKKLITRERPENIIKQIMHFRGTLAQAAPAELAEVTYKGLVPNPQKKDSHFLRGIRDEIVSHVDSEFMPSSPTQGPFLDLLNAAPEDGLALIRRLVNHAIEVLNDGWDADDDGITLFFPSGLRNFPKLGSYYWSRSGLNCYSIESGLMALEAWSHKRIEDGDKPDEVIADVLGPEGTPAAFVLVAVDILISHWPKTKNSALPFLGSPELLSNDRTRQAQDRIGFGFSSSRGLAGQITLADLQNRPSRRILLEKLLGSFTLSDGADLSKLRHLLEVASEKLGRPESGDTFATPRFMAKYALNQTNRKNWHPKDDGFIYVSPSDEAEHIAALEAERAKGTLELNISGAIQGALEDATESSPELVKEAIKYAKLLGDSDTAVDDIGSLTNAIVSTAMIVARDGDDQILNKNEDWVRRVFLDVFASTAPDRAREMREGIHYNPIAIATLGLIHLWRRRGEEADRDVLLELAGRESVEAAHGMGAGLETLHRIDPRIISTILRCALNAQIRPICKRDDSEEDKQANLIKRKEKLTAVIEAEQAWLRGETAEPDWPPFPAQQVHIKRSIRIGGGEPADEQKNVRDDAVDELLSQRAALWVRQMTSGANVDDLTWLPKFISSYADWTAKANGAGLDANEDVRNNPDAWNSVFYRMLTKAVPGMHEDDAAAEVARAIAVPDRAFFDIATELVPAIDELYFDGQRLDLGTVLKFRGLVADRLVESAGWRRERSRSDLLVEMGIGPAIGVMFFGHYSPIGKSRCYLPSKGIDQLDPFLPHLTCLIEDGSVPFTAQLTMDLLEVSPKSEHLGFFLSSAVTWLTRQPTNTQLWVDFGLGARLAKQLELATQIDTALRLKSHPLRTQMDDVLARLVQIGVAEAYRVERSFL